MPEIEDPASLLQLIIDGKVEIVSPSDNNEIPASLPTDVEELTKNVSLPSTEPVVIEETTQGSFIWNTEIENIFLPAPAPQKARMLFPKKRKGFDITQVAYKCGDNN